MTPAPATPPTRYALVLGYPAAVAAGLEAVLRRCGFNAVARLHAEEEALRALFGEAVDLLLLAGSARAHGLVAALRQHPGCGSRRAHMIVTLERIDAPEVVRLRDAGVSQVAQAPLSEAELTTRVELMRRDRRRFIDSPVYCGPDRRVRQLARYGLVPRRTSDYGVYRNAG